MMFQSHGLMGIVKIKHISKPTAIIRISGFVVYDDDDDDQLTGR